MDCDDYTYDYIKYPQFLLRVGLKKCQYLFIWKLSFLHPLCCSVRGVSKKFMESLTMILNTSFTLKANGRIV